MSEPTAPIVFYDIPSRNETHKAWSPNTWKVRFALNIKGLNYKTEWVEYPDIEDLYQKLRLPAALFKDDGSPYYCLPVIHDSSTNTTLADSFAIVKYLDKTYPNTETLLPTSTLSFHSVLVTLWPKLQARLWPIVVCASHNNLNTSSQEYFRRTREAKVGKRLEDLRDENEWQEAEKAYEIVKGWLDESSDKDKLLFVDDKISFADLIVVSDLIWAKIGLGEDSEEWKRICGWHDGRWKALTDRFAQYTVVN
ncbi:glutathione transferase GTE1 [Trametopsis cervina]|nr:glutathione transferase GTE1 [Trametopsis cervina]